MMDWFDYGSTPKFGGLTADDDDDFIVVIELLLVTQSINFPGNTISFPIRCFRRMLTRGKDQKVGKSYLRFHKLTSLPDEFLGKRGDRKKVSHHIAPSRRSRAKHIQPSVLRGKETEDNQLHACEAK